MATRLEQGDVAPDFTLTSHTGEEITLSALRGRKVVLYAYPAAMTPGCTTQACDFRDARDPFADAGYAVYGISPDSEEKLARFVEKEQLTFPLLSDPDKAVLTAYGAYGEKTTYGKKTVGVIRSTFVVDEEGRIALAKYNVRAKGHVASLAKTLGIDLPAPTDS